MHFGNFKIVVFVNSKFSLKNHSNPDLIFSLDSRAVILRLSGMLNSMGLKNLDLILYNKKSKCGFHDFHRLRRHYNSFTRPSLWKPSELNYLKKWIKICKEIFWAFKKHLQSHNRKSVGGTLENMCDRGNCGKTFRFESELRMHLRLHDNAVTKCSFCPWKTSNPTYLQQHIDHHFKTPKFNCSKCDRSFYIKNNLDHHFETTHEIIKDKYKCKICPYKTNSKSNFCHHLRRNHKI